jgi:thiamine biosynthesis protein ThiS
MTPRSDAPPVDIRVNGDPHQVSPGSSVSDLLAELGRHPRTVAVEYNGDILPRDMYPVTPLASGDRLEIVHFVQGGLESA